jgi:rare lipoprotein A
MRLPVDAGFRFAVPLVVLTAALAGCGLIGGGERVASLSTVPDARIAGVGPAADYPVVLGEPFTVEGELYTPADSMNYDAVGYVATDDGGGVTAAHRTLPLPSYAEVTSLESGKTILVRVERRGPMTGTSLIALSPAAVAQLGVGDGAAVRLRRVNPAEAERAELRAGRPAPDRIATPKSLVEVLRRKLPRAGAVSLAGTAPGQRASTVAPASPGVVMAGPAGATGSRSAVSGPRPVTAYPLARLGDGKGVAPRPTVVARPQPTPRVVATTAPSKLTSPIALAPKGAFVVQAGTFSSRANADRAAKSLNGFVVPSGQLFRVRTGPFATRAQADAPLAKVRAAGYSDARVTTAG